MDPGALMELRQIDCFLAVATELHFGKAAERLILAQSSVSEAIRSLEQEIGGRLFLRTSRRVALTELGAKLRVIGVTHSGYRATAAIELTWALILASSRHLVEEAHSIRAGGWQTTVGQELAGRVLGVLGLGNIGREVARIALAFGMQVIAWSQNLEPSRAAAIGATWVAKDELFRQADILTIHLLLSHRTRGLVTAADLALMKPTARLINTSRGPIIDEQALIDTLRTRSIAGAALDVYDIEPLPADHPFRRLDNYTAHRLCHPSPVPDILRRRRPRHYFVADRAVGRTDGFHSRTRDFVRKLRFDFTRQVCMICQTDRPVCLYSSNEHTT